MQKTEAKMIWSQPPDVLDLQPGQADVWRISLDLPTASVKLLESALSEDESRRAARFRFPVDRDRYILAHGALRHILARYLSRKPDQINFSTNEYGKPALQGHPLEFNLSHSGDFALVAVAKGHKVGVDVERFRSELDLERMASRFFSRREVSELTALSPEGRLAAFFRCWTRKEAYVKAQGLGLSLPLKNFDVSLSDPAILRATRPDPDETSHWTLLSLDVGPGYAGAVAVANAALNRRPELVEGLTKGEDIEFRLWDWNTRVRVRRT